MPFNTLSPFTLGVTTPPPTVVAGSISIDRNSSVVTSITQNISSNVQQGHTLLAIVCSDTNDASGSGDKVVPPSGWTDCSGSFIDNGSLGIFYFTKQASSADAGSSSTWTISYSKSVNSSMLITIAFRDAKIGTVQALSSYSTGSTMSVAWFRSVQNSIILPVMFSKSTSIGGITGVTDPSGFTELVNAVDNVNAYGDAVVWTSGIGSTSSGTFTSTISGTGVNFCCGFVEVLPSTAIPPTSPTWNDASYNSYSIASTTNGTTYPIDAPIPPHTAGDIIVVFYALSNGVSVTGGWTPPAGFTTIMTKTNNPSLLIAYKVSGSSESGSYTASYKSSGGSYSGWAASLSISKAQYDTVGTASTNVSAGNVHPTINVTNNYSAVFAFLAGSNNGAWTAKNANNTMTDRGGLLSLSTSPGINVFYQTDISSGLFDPGSDFQTSAGAGSTYGIAVSFSHI